MLQIKEMLKKKELLCEDSLRYFSPFFGKGILLKCCPNNLINCNYPTTSDAELGFKLMKSEYMCINRERVKVHTSTSHITL